MRTLKLEALSADRIDQAYPLMQMIRPALDMQAWRRHAEELLAAPEAGVTLLQDPRGLILGLFAWRVHRDPEHGRTLACEDFVALDIVGSARVAEALADGLEETARGHGCAAVHTCVAAASGGTARRLVDRLCGLGHRMESFMLCKSLSTAG